MATILVPAGMPSPVSVMPTDRPRPVAGRVRTCPPPETANCEAENCVTLTGLSDWLPLTVTALLSVMPVTALFWSRVTLVMVVPAGMPVPSTDMPTATSEMASAPKLAELMTLVPAASCALVSDLIDWLSTATGCAKVTALPLTLEMVVVLDPVPPTLTTSPAWTSGLAALMVAPVTMMVPLLFTSVGVSWNAVTDDTEALLSDSAIVCALTLTSGVLPPSPPRNVLHEAHVVEGQVGAAVDEEHATQAAAAAAAGAALRHEVGEDGVAGDRRGRLAGHADHPAAGAIAVHDALRDGVRPAGRRQRDRGERAEARRARAPGLPRPRRFRNGHPAARGSVPNQTKYVIQRWPFH